ncbi:hypothetical protein GCM10027562_28380 [Arthrobacter pigmenti]
MLDESEPLAGLLRKCLLLGAETGSDSLREWARNELNGYEEGDEVPDYRKVHGVPISMDSISGNAMAKNQIINRHQLPKEAWEYVPESFSFKQTVEEMEKLAGQESLSLTSTRLAFAQTVWNGKLGPYQSITGLSYTMSGSAVAGILGQIRTKLVDLIADLTADTPLSELPGKERVDAVVSQRIGTDGDIYNTTVHGAAGPVAIGARAKAKSEGITVEESLRLLGEVQRAAADVDEPLRTELEDAIEDLSAVVKQDKPDTGVVVKKVGRLQVITEKIGVSSVSAATGGAAQALTELALGGAFPEPQRWNGAAASRLRDQPEAEYRLAGGKTARRRAATRDKQTGENSEETPAVSEAQRKIDRYEAERVRHQHQGQDEVSPSPARGPNIGPLGKPCRKNPLLLGLKHSSVNGNVESLQSELIGVGRSLTWQTSKPCNSVGPTLFRHVAGEIFPLCACCSESGNNMNDSAAAGMPVNLGDLTTSELRRFAGNAVLVIPLGATEQHGPCLPLNTDTTLVNYILHTASHYIKTQGPIVLGPALPYGQSQHHLFAGALSLRPHTLLTMLTDVIDSAYATGFKRILFVNGHGGNDECVRIAVKDGVLRNPMVLGACNYWDLCEPEWRKRYAHIPGHAGAFETSLMMAAAPDLVRFEDLHATHPGDLQEHSIVKDVTIARTGDWSSKAITDSPGEAEAELGKHYLNSISCQLAAVVERFAMLSIP